MIEIKKIQHSDFPAIFAVFEQCFPEYAPIGKPLLNFLNDVVNWEISLKAVLDEKIIGFYLLGNRKIASAIIEEQAVPHEDLSRYEPMCGIEGVALGIIPEFRKMGLTEQLKQQVKTISNIDYIYGMQYKSLSNLTFWLRTRRLVAESFTEEPVYFTLEDISMRARFK
ncbi:MAG TPA: hypothetical protein VL995_17920 [Cellvibrio sp.]|nr:hypothetical protein [Cellvibrio sp.]